MLVTPCTCVLSYLHISEERGAFILSSTLKMNTAGPSETSQIVTSHMILNPEDYNLKISLTSAVAVSSTRTGKYLYICSVCVRGVGLFSERVTLGRPIDRCSTRPESRVPTCGAYVLQCVASRHIMEARNGE
jgi:hypothetical protein